MHRTEAVGATILVIEDQETTRRVIAEILTRAGYAVVSASDGTSGLYLANQVQPALVILDLLLPDMDGTELAALLPGHPFVALTADQDEGKFDALRRYGMMGYLLKPPDPAVFARQVQVAIDRAKETSTLRRAVKETRVVAQALGVLMAREGISEQQAFASLQRAASKQGRRVAQIAAEIVDDMNRSIRGRSI